MMIFAMYTIQQMTDVCHSIVVVMVGVVAVLCWSAVKNS